MNVPAILAALLIPFAGTALGSAFVFFLKKDIAAPVQKAMLGFASGVMGFFLPFFKISLAI